MSVVTSRPEVDVKSPHRVGPLPPAPLTTADAVGAVTLARVAVANLTVTRSIFRSLSACTLQHTCMSVLLAVPASTSGPEWRSAHAGPSGAQAIG